MRQSKRELHFGYRRRTSDARPYNNVAFLFDAPVGAAIGRPPVKIRKDVKQNASAKTTIANLIGRDSSITICANLNANCISATADGRAMLAPTGAGLLIIRSFIHYYKSGVHNWTPAILLIYQQYIIGIPQYRHAQS